MVLAKVVANIQPLPYPVPAGTVTGAVQPTAAAEPAARPSAAAVDVSWNGVSY